jgi:hypothetical protein
VTERLREAEVDTSTYNLLEPRLAELERIVPGAGSLNLLHRSALAEATEEFFRRSQVRA